MKKVLLCLAISSMVHGNEKAINTNVDINNMTVAGLTIQRAGFTDAGDVIHIFSNPDVSRYAFGAKATEEQIKQHANSKSDYIKFAAVLVYEKYRGNNYFWTIRQQEEPKKQPAIGFIGLEQCDEKLIQLLQTNDPDHFKNYRNLSIILTKESWHKHHATNSLKKLLNVVFNARQFSDLKGVACGIVDGDSHTTELIHTNGELKKPFSPLGSVEYPQGLSHIIPNPSTVNYFLITKNDFLHLLENENIGKN